MRHTRCFRLMAALFGVWFTFTLIQPNGMMGMTMSGSSTTMDMSDAGMSSMRMPSGVVSAEQMAAMHSTSTSERAAEQAIPDQSTAPVECNQHDCCCSALSPISLMPVATLSWLPEQVINAETPDTGDCVVHTDGQLLLPFANGPPRTVTA